MGVFVLAGVGIVMALIQTAQWYSRVRSARVRVNGKHHQAAYDLLCDLCIAVARRQGGEIVDKRAPKGAA